jgi:HK97 family phage portal protein
MFGLSRVEKRAGNQYDTAMRALTGQRLYPTYAGVAANYADMLTIPAVWKSIQLTAGIVSVMPIDAYRDRDDSRTEVRPTPKLLVEPSAFLPLEDWIFQAIESMIMHGDVIGRIVQRDGRMSPTQIELVDPAAVTIKRRPDGDYDFYFDRVLIPRDEVWHVPGRPRLGTPFGFGLIEFMAQTAGVALAARKYEAQWFGDGAHPTSILRPATDPGPAGAQLLKDRLLGIMRGNREPLVLPPGTDLQSLQTNPVEAALLEAMRANANDIAHFFGVPPELVGGTSGDSMTYSNVEARVLDLLAFAVQYWMTKLEKALSRSLWPKPLYVKFNEGAITRTDLRTKVETLVAEVRGGLRTPNEGRRLLDLPALPGGDDLVLPNAVAPVTVGSIPDEPPS